MSEKKLEIASIEKLFKMSLLIPNYQRPYRWSIESVSILFSDIYEAMNKDILEYRIGSVILHKNGEEKYEIVDGQQRITTLSILLYCLDKHNTLLEEKTFNDLSEKAIIENYQILRRYCEKIDKEKFKKYLLENCTFVKIIVDSEQEAFQFFDSQNSRGKALAPQDLLKSYHLREMADSDENQKIKIISTWENENQKELAKFFEYHLYPLVQWCKGKDGLYYSDKKIKVFKGIKKENIYNYSIYHKAANLYIENFNYQNLYELTNSEKITQFQLTQPLIAGERFFYYTHYYFNLYKKILKEIDKRKVEYEFIFENGTGNSYVKNLFINILIFFVDRFNIKELNDERFEILCGWAYSLRIVMSAVYIETINKYALGKHDRINNENLFEKIAQMQKPQELDNIILNKPDSVEEKYEKISEKFFGVKNG
ncbi:DUF262 domain-containing protein [Campylobacter sp. JMF_01 NE2]|uniref:DUF262 domain-containing protein n=1 Tax=unclassified Campylobacter TaxID=2593542 RepID=UPI0022EA0C7E|nr:MULTISPECIES: DUF262 domain-containing protein [unclassified Campylobacter]MDA3052842.1 DUF262 domain-containing protein [Campylobacter sp. JMF_03 NE3]MDA3067173.1 DUF262 domain-containing protein [Campylobacter sp. JMF_01 NE2]